MHFLYDIVKYPKSRTGNTPEIEKEYLIKVATPYRRHITYRQPRNIARTY